MDQKANAQFNHQTAHGYIDSLGPLHNIREEDHHESSGREAKQAIFNRLTSWPKAQIFATEVCDFYGDYLQYHESALIDSSYYRIDLHHDPVGLKNVLIELQLGTPRIAEALCHELLHLNTRMQGYPIGEKFWIPYALAQCAGTIAGIYPKIGNLIEHELMIEMFLGLGFEKSNFLACLSPPPDYRELASKAKGFFCYKEEIGFSWWCLEYFRHWISTRHSMGNEAHIYANNALYWGSKVHPEIKVIAPKIRGLLESGALMDIKKPSSPCQYTFNVDENPGVY